MMRDELSVDGISLDAFREFFEKRAGERIPWPYKPGKTYKVPKMKVKESTKDILRLRRGDFFVTVLRIDSGVKMILELKWVFRFWASLILGAFIWPLLLSSLAILIMRYTVWPKQVPKWNHALVEGAKADAQRAKMAKEADNDTLP